MPISLRRAEGRASFFSRGGGMIEISRLEGSRNPELPGCKQNFHQISNTFFWNFFDAKGNHCAKSWR